MNKVCLCLLLALSACSLPSTPERTRYMLGEDALPKPEDSAEVSGIVRVARPIAEFGLENDHIQVQRADGRITGVDNTAWVEPPAKMLQPLLVRALEQYGQFRVIDDHSTAEADSELQTAIERLTLVYPTDGQSPHVEVALRVQLVGLPGNELLASRRISASEPVQNLHMAYVIPAFNKALAACLGDVIATLRDATATSAKP